MATNEQRREAAKRKLTQQLEEREQRARRRTRFTIGGSVLAVALIAGGTYGFSYWNDHKPKYVSCQYAKSDAPSAKPGIKQPPTTHIRTNGAATNIKMVTSQGDIGLTLNSSESPCTVNSFVSLVHQGFFNNTPCPRVATEGIKMLQCGDPTGTTSGGPGYQFANEYPTTKYSDDDPKLQSPQGDYKRGVIAMANTGDPGTNGSQFFLVFGDSQLPPQYTIFGTIDQTGLKTLDKIAAGGIDPTKPNPAGGGAPKLAVTIKSVT